MSEYSYYEWQAIDRPLTPEEQQAVNSLSSHIDVSSSHALVTYNWGEFKHDERQVLLRYFDAFLFHFNGGSQRLIFRFPAAVLDADALDPYLWEDAVELERAGAFWVMEIKTWEDGKYDMSCNAELAALAPLRDAILDGDYRVLYLAWLQAASLALADKGDLAGEQEPPVPAGLGQLTPSLAGFVKFFDIDRYLIQAAAQASPSLQAQAAPDYQAAIQRLPQGERQSFLLRLAQNEPGLSRSFRKRLHDLLPKAALPATQAARRTIGEIKTQARMLRERAARLAREKAARERMRALEAFAPQAEQAWNDIDLLIARKTPTAYDEAVALLVRLLDLARYQSRLGDFERRLLDLQALYPNRPALQERLRSVLHRMESGE